MFTHTPLHLFIYLFIDQMAIEDFHNLSFL